MQSIEAQHPLPISQCLRVIARTNESQVVFLPYINRKFNLFTAIFPANICFLSISLAAHLKCGRLRHGIPSPFFHVWVYSACKPESGRVFAIYKFERLIYLLLFSEQIYVFLSISLAAHLKCGRLRHSIPCPFPNGCVK